jgi:hypothetical protein
LAESREVLTSLFRVSKPRFVLQIGRICQYYDNMGPRHSGISFFEVWISILCVRKVPLQNGRNFAVLRGFGKPQIVL